MLQWSAHDVRVPSRPKWENGVWAWTGSCDGGSGEYNKGRTCRKDTHLVSTVVPRNFLTKDENSLVPEHLLFHGSVQSLTNGHLSSSEAMLARIRSTLVRGPAHRVFALLSRVSPPASRKRGRDGTSPCSSTRPEKSTESRPGGHLD